MIERPLVYAQEWYFWVLGYFDSRLHLLIYTFVVGHAHIIWLLLLCRSVYGIVQYCVNCHSHVNKNIHVLLIEHMNPHRDVLYMALYQYTNLP